MDDIERRLRDDATAIESALEPDSPPDRDTATAPGWRRWALAAAAIPLIGLVVAAGVIVSNLGDEDRVEPDVPRATKASVEPTEPPPSTVPADAGLLRVTQRPTECCNESGQVSRLVLRARPRGRVRTRRDVPCRRNGFRGVAGAGRVRQS